MNNEMPEYTGDLVRSPTNLALQLDLFLPPSRIDAGTAADYPTGAIGLSPCRVSRRELWGRRGGTGVSEAGKAAERLQAKMCFRAAAVQGRRNRQL